MLIGVSPVCVCFHRERSSGDVGCLFIFEQAHPTSLIGVELVHVPYLTQGPSHLLYNLHVFEGRVQGIGGRAHTIHHRVPRSLGGAPCLLVGGARRLSGVA